MSIQPIQVDKPVGPKGGTLWPNDFMHRCTPPLRLSDSPETAKKLAPSKVLARSLRCALPQSCALRVAGAPILLAIAAAICVVPSGCTVCQSLQRTMRHEPATYPWKHDRKRSIEVYRRWAEQAWLEAAASCPDMLSDGDYSLGFHDGFVDFVYAGGTAEPPPVPPRQYWNAALRSPDGKQRADQWFAGYRHGAQVARDGGYRELGTIRTTLVPTAFDPYETEIEPVPEIAPDGDDGPRMWETHELPLPQPVPGESSFNAPPDGARSFETLTTSTAQGRSLSDEAAALIQNDAEEATATTTSTELGPELPLPALTSATDFTGAGWVRRDQGAAKTSANRSADEAFETVESTAKAPATARPIRDVKSPRRPATPDNSEATHSKAPLRFRTGQTGQSDSAKPESAASSYRVLGATRRDDANAPTAVVVRLEADSTSSGAGSVQALHIVDSYEEDEPSTAVGENPVNQAATSTIRVRPISAASNGPTNGRIRHRGPAFRR